MVARAHAATTSTRATGIAFRVATSPSLPSPRIGLSRLVRRHPLGRATTPKGARASHAAVTTSARRSSPPRSGSASTSFGRRGSSRTCVASSSAYRANAASASPTSRLRRRRPPRRTRHGALDQPCSSSSPASSARCDARHGAATPLRRTRAHPARPPGLDDALFRASALAAVDAHLRLFLRARAARRHARASPTVRPLPHPLPGGRAHARVRRWDRRGPAQLTERAHIVVRPRTSASTTPSTACARDGRFAACAAPRSTRRDGAGRRIRRTVRRRTVSRRTVHRRTVSRTERTHGARCTVAATEEVEQNAASGEATTQRARHLARMRAACLGRRSAVPPHRLGDPLATAATSTSACACPSLPRSRPRTRVAARTWCGGPLRFRPTTSPSLRRVRGAPCRRAGLARPVDARRQRAPSRRRIGRCSSRARCATRRRRRCARSSPVFATALSASDIAAGAHQAWGAGVAAHLPRRRRCARAHAPTSRWTRALARAHDLLHRSSSRASTSMAFGRDASELRRGARPRAHAHRARPPTSRRASPRGRRATLLDDAFGRLEARARRLVGARSRVRTQTRVRPHSTARRRPRTAPTRSPFTPPCRVSTATRSSRAPGRGRQGQRHLDAFSRVDHRPHRPTTTACVAARRRVGAASPASRPSAMAPEARAGGRCAPDPAEFAAHLPPRLAHWMSTTGPACPTRRT